MDFARNERGFCVGFAWNLILFSFVREREGYKHHADCTVGNSKKNLDPRGWSAPILGQYTCILQKYSKIFFSETTWPIKAQFYRKHLWEGGINVFINNPGHMTRWPPCPYMVKTL